MNNYVGLATDGAFKTAPQEEEYLELYTKFWADTMSATYFKNEKIDTGHKLRPRLVYWGYLAGNPSNNCNLESVAKIAVAMELIHKSSLLLDDFVDKDTSRHGETAFYIKHGIERMVMYSLNLLSRALLLADSVPLVRNSMTPLLNCMQDMSLGVLLELDTNMHDSSSLNAVHEIITLETTSLIKTSILMGYYISGNPSTDIENTLKELSLNVGEAFQYLNDMESVFGSTVDEHKGTTHSDISASRKNICYGLLQTLMNANEHLDLLNNQSTVYKLFEKYKIKDITLADIKQLTGKIDNLIENSTIVSSWKMGFKEFYQSIIKVYLNRLGENS